MVNVKRNENAILLVLFLLFILVRIFVASPYCFISMDEAKYLSLAASFPRHTLFNNQLYLVHPPLYPYLIRVFSLLLADHTAGVTVSFVFALISFLTLIKIFRLWERNSYWITIALLVVTVSPLHIPTSRVIYKDSMFFGLFLISLYLYLKGLIVADAKYLGGAGIAGSACCLTSDLGMFLLPSFIIGWFIFRGPGLRLRAVAPTFIILLAVYGGWLLVRYNVFRDNAYYPVGVDGTIEYVQEFTVRQLFTPRYFPYTMTMFNFTPDLSCFRINANVYDLYPIMNLPSYLYYAFYALVGFRVFVNIINAFVNKAAKNNPDLFFSILFLIFGLPAVLHPEPRFLITILLPMSYLFANLIASEFPPRSGVTKIIAGGMVVILLATTVKYLLNNGNVIFSLKKETESSRVAQLLESLPRDGVMAQVGYPPEIVYLTGKRVVALPVDPQQLDTFIKTYDIHYLLYGQHYLAPLSIDNASLIWCYNTIKHIQQNPAKYPLLKIVKENYQAKQWPDLIFVHGVRRD